MSFLGQALPALALWIALSAGLIIFNASLLTEFRHPIAVTCFHMCVCSVLILGLRLVRPDLLSTENVEAGLPPLTLRKTLEVGFPVAVVQTVCLTAGNAAILFIPVSFAQMIKAWTPVTVYLCGVGIGTQQWSSAVFKTIFLVTMGLSVATASEVSFNLKGFLLQLVAVLCEGVRINLVEQRMGTKGYRLNPLTSMQVFAPQIFVLLAICSLCLDRGAFSMAAIHKVGGDVFMLNALLAFFLNLSIYFAIQVASGLIFTLAGIFKDLSIIVASCFLFHYRLTALELVGYAISIAGVQAFVVVSKNREGFERVGLCVGLWMTWKGEPPAASIGKAKTEYGSAEKTGKNVEKP